MRAEPSLTAVVTGLRGEPYLRFSPAGVAVNTQSATWFLDRVRPLVVPRGITSSTPPQWKLLTSRHSWTWHEGRLHTPALSAHPSGNTYVGRWVVPIEVDGRGTAIRGGLWQSAPASLLWFWPLLVVAACIPALLKLREARLEGRVGAALAVVALLSSTVARLGRELYGRPTRFDLAAGARWRHLSRGRCSCRALLPAGLARARRNADRGLRRLPGAGASATLRDGWVLAAIPAWLERSATGLVARVGDRSRPRVDHPGDSRPCAGSRAASAALSGRRDAGSGGAPRSPRGGADHADDDLGPTRAAA